MTVSLTDIAGQVIQNPANSATTKRTQYIYNLSQIYSPVEYPVEGTPFFTEDYLESHIFSDLGDQSGIQMRYNIYYDRMEFKQGDALQAMDPNLKIKKIVLGDYIFIVDNIEHKGEMVPTYYQLLDSGRVSLLAKMRVTFKGPQPGKPIEGDVPAKYQRMADTFYFRFGNGPLEKVRSMKKIIEVLPDGKQKMEEFAKTEKISTNNSQELTKFFQHYNSIK